MLNKKYRREISLLLILVSKYNKNKNIKTKNALNKKANKIKIFINELLTMQKEINSMVLIYGIYINNIREKIKNG